MNGKGSRRRPGNDQAYRETMDRIRFYRGLEEALERAERTTDELDRARRVDLNEIMKPLSQRIHELMKG